MLDNLLVVLLVALALQIVLTRRFARCLQVRDPALFERLDRPNGWFFMLHGGPGDDHPFLRFVLRDAAEIPELSVDAVRLRRVYRLVSLLWLATIASAVWQVVSHLRN